MLVSTVEMLGSHPGHHVDFEGAPVRRGQRVVVREPVRAGVQVLAVACKHHIIEENGDSALGENE